MSTWRLEDVWNNVLISERRPQKPRDYIYASEIGKNFYERYHKMIGTPYTNPYEERVLRKFSAGIFFEELIGHMLNKIGILKADQKKIEVPATSGHLRVSGRLDFVAGGVTDWKQAEKRVREAEFPQAVENIALSLIKDFAEAYPEGLEDKLLEIKSVNSQVFWAKKDYLQEAYRHHMFQTYAYMRQEGYKIGTIVYISKDDLTIKEIDIIATPELEDEFMEDIRQMSEFYNTKTEPPLPDRVVYDKRNKLRFSAKKKLEAYGTVQELGKVARENGLGEITGNYNILVVGSWKANYEIGWSPYRNMMASVKNDEEWEVFDAQSNAMARDKNSEIKEHFITELLSLI